MKGDLGCDNCVGKGEERQEVYERLRELEQGSRRVSSAEELEALEREIRTLRYLRTGLHGYSGECALGAARAGESGCRGTTGEGGGADPQLSGEDEA